jgi:excisionase family DNA binding protein
MAQAEPNDGTLTVQGAAAYLGVSEALIRKMVLERHVRYYKLGRFLRFERADLDACRVPVEPVDPQQIPNKTLRNPSLLRAVSSRK